MPNYPGGFGVGTLFSIVNDSGFGGICRSISLPQNRACRVDRDQCGTKSSGAH